METVSNISSEEELLQLCDEGKISEAEYNDLLGAMKKPSLRTEPSEDEPPAKSRLSRPAVWGAILAPFFFVMLMLKFTSHSHVVVEGQQPPGPQWWQYLLRFTVLPIGIAAPFATTILGMISISQIRHSAGKLHGLGLAVADTLLFPLLALLGICYWFVTLMDEICVEAKIYGSGHPISQEASMFGIAFIIWAILAWFCSRLLWRAANKPIEHS